MFSPGAQGNFNLLDIPNVELLLWQDFRYEEAVAKYMGWGQWLNISGGEMTQIGCPQNGAKKNSGELSNINYEVP